MTELLASQPYIAGMPEFGDPDDQHWYEERAAIMEFDAGLPRRRAEEKAYLLAVRRG